MWMVQLPPQRRFTADHLGDQEVSQRVSFMILAKPYEAFVGRVA
jgi:hypothetical protein